MKKKNFDSVNTILIVALVAVLTFSLYLTFSVQVPEKQEYVAPPARQIEATLVGVDCSQCFNSSVLVEYLKATKGFNVTNVNEVKLNESKELALKYNFTKLPAVVITGELENLTTLQAGPAQGPISFTLSGDAFIFSDFPAPYYDVEKRKVKGLVTSVILKDSSCKDCFDLAPSLNQMKSLGIKITSSKTVELSSEEGKNLVGKYKIEKVPAIILNNEGLEYPVLKDTWDQVGSVETDGNLVLRLVAPPYVNTTSGKVDGLVELTILSDSSCETCYNHSVLKQVFEQNFNLKFSAAKTVESNSTRGKLLLKKYSIELVPTALISKEASLYPSVPQVWTQVLGTQEKDGMFVMRNLQVLSQALRQDVVYKNLTSGELIDTASLKAQQAASNPAEEAEITPPEASAE